MVQSKHNVIRVRCHTDDYDTVRLRLDAFCSFGDELPVWCDNNVFKGTMCIEYDDEDVSFVPIPVTDMEAAARGKCLISALRFYANGGQDNGETAREALKEIWGL